MTRHLLRLLAGLYLSMVSIAISATDAVPTISQVYHTAESGNLVEAVAMMQKVLVAHPNSAKAHFVESELLAREGQLLKARAQLRVAQRLEPGLPFAKPAAVRRLEARLENSAGSGRSGVFAGNGSGRLLFGLAGIVVVFLLLRAFTSRRGAVAYPAGSPTAFNGAPGYPGAYAGGSGLGSSVLGGLATGAAMGAGMVAGEALAHRILDTPASEPQYDAALGDPIAPGSDADMGGNDFGIADDSSWDDGSGIADGGDVSGDDWS